MFFKYLKISITMDHVVANHACESNLLHRKYFRFVVLKVSQMVSLTQ